MSKIEGVTRFGNAWAIPIDAKKPTDGRVTTGEYRNWRKKTVSQLDFNSNSKNN